jgi:2-polyprenyl-3-methyl-5-hydroxy-6-metoxy-1,4-benzoquinol methylase
VDRAQWNERYAAKDLVWGTDPNRFVAAELARLGPARALDLACGEGRNAIWLAKRGWRVTAVDYSGVAIERARRLAAEQQVDVEWIEADVTRYAAAAGGYELILVAYLHLPPEQRRAVLRHAAAALAPGGTLFMVGHARRNLAEGVGGPQRPEVLWEPEEIRQDLADVALVAERIEQVERPVETPEGTRQAIDVVVRAARLGASLQAGHR